MMRMHNQLKAVSPAAVVSVAPSIYPWSKQNYLQDWPTWLENGWVDEVCPQVYRDRVESYRAELTKIATVQVSAANRSRVFPGVLIRTAGREFNGVDRVRSMVAENRKLGFEGEVYFYDAALEEFSALFAELYQ